MSHFEQHVERIIQRWLRQQRTIQMYELTEPKVLCHVQRPLPERKKKNG